MRRLRTIALAALCLAAVSSVLANSVSLAGDEGVTNLRWKPGAIRIAISSSLLRDNPNVKRDSDVAGAVRRSIDAWSRVANIEIVLVNSDKVNVSPSGPSGDGLSLITIAPSAENVLLFSKDPENTAATTRVFYNRRGTITEADIVLNPYQQFSTDGTLGTFDLESTLTHEIGHLLGLPHSLVLGSTMHANSGKNGAFGIQNISSRTLSADDIAAVRTLYGVREDVDCCGGVEGRLVIGGKQSRTAQVWIEDSAGRVNGSTRTNADGSFRFDGLTNGKYRMFAQDAGKSRSGIDAQDLGEVSVESGETTSVHSKAVLGNREFDLTYVGFNGQLSEMAVALSAGRSYVVYLGGRNLDPKRINISFSSPYLTVVNSTLRSHDYGDDISVVSFEVRVSARAQRGEYSILVESEQGAGRAIVGGLTVDNAPNAPTNTFSFDD